eukprot:4642798-Karenia_brevis.AAC.1
MDKTSTAACDVLRSVMDSTERLSTLTPRTLFADLPNIVSTTIPGSCGASWSRMRDATAADIIMPRSRSD